MNNTAHKDSKRRLVIMTGLTSYAFLFAAFVVLIQFFYFNIIKSEEYDNIKKKKFKEVVIRSERGNIYSWDGRLMACTMPRFKLCIDPTYIPDTVFNRDIKKLAAKLSAFYKDKSAGAYEQMIKQARVKGREYLIVNSRWLTYEEFQEVRTFPILCEKKNNAMNSVAEKEFERRRFFGTLAERTIGKIRKDSTNKIIGIRGLEQAYNEYLAGKDGSGIRTRTLGAWATVEKENPINGSDLITTIDVDIQDVAEYSLREQLEYQKADRGVAIIMDVKTGAIRAMVNLKQREQNGKTVYIEDHYNFAIGEPIEPGSTFKLASIMACLEDEFVTSKDTINTFKGAWKIHDRTMRDSHDGGFGMLTIDMAFAKSSNIAFGRLMEKYYSNTPEKFIDRMYDFGLCDDLKIELAGAKPTYITKPGNEKTWSGTSLHWLSTGYGVQITPLQLLTFYNAVANGGKMMKPMFVEAIKSDNKIIKEIQPIVLRNSIASTKTIRAVHDMLKLVVEEGTASTVNDASCQLAGKTGTAQIAKGSQGYGHKDNDVKHLASFAGFFPANNPLYSCIVMVYEPRRNIYGSQVSAMVVRDIANRVYATEFARGNVKEEPKIEKTKLYPYSKGGRKTDMKVVFDELDIPCDIDDINKTWVSTSAKENGIDLSPRSFVGDMVPNVIGMGASDAVSLLESMGLKVQLIGYGSVRRQSLKAGTTFTKGQVISIELSNG